MTASHRKALPALPQPGRAPTVGTITKARTLYTEDVQRLVMQHR